MGVPTQPPAVATLLLETGDVRCGVQEVTAHRIVISVDGDVPEDGSYRLAIYHSGRASGLIRLLCKLTEVKTSGGQTILTLRFLALHSTERPTRCRKHNLFNWVMKFPYQTLEYC